MTGTADRVDSAIAALGDGISGIGNATDIRSHARAVAGMLAAIRGLGRAASGCRSAKAAILDYLLASVGTPVSGGELEAVSGISEYARRVRELRAEGWPIAGGAAAPSSQDRRAMRRLALGPLGSDDYVLLSPSRRRTSAKPEAAVAVAA